MHKLSQMKLKPSLGGLRHMAVMQIGPIPLLPGLHRATVN